MCCLTDNQKRDHVLNFLVTTAQEVIIPELPTIQTWDQMRDLSLDEFVSEISLEVKKNLFVYIAFKTKETLAEFAHRF